MLKVSAKVSDGETVDAILGGAIRIAQPRRGYRFSVEAILLARFATAAPRDRVLDLGAGCGVVAITLARLGGVKHLAAVEIQPAMAALAERNAALNHLPDLRVICADLRSPRIIGLAAASFDLVVANPPFHAISAGRDSPDASRRIARGEGAASIADFIRAARRYARTGGRVAFVFAASRSAELIATMRSHRLEPKRIRFVHPRAELAASAILIEARVGGGAEVIVEAPLVLHDRPGRYTDEARAILEAPSLPACE
ncbi:MAG: tRNA1(Val) (adenine(37)-N6)-methyltransferase [Candidatus Binataceae bacterium]